MATMRTLRYELASQAKTSWYSKVRVRQSWEDEQDDAETDWGELFFDLNYVAMVSLPAHKTNCS